jgi:hypothetical protein
LSSQHSKVVTSVVTSRLLSHTPPPPPPIPRLFAMAGLLSAGPDRRVNASGVAVAGPLRRCHLTSQGNKNARRSRQCTAAASGARAARWRSAIARSSSPFGLAFVLAGAPLPCAARGRSTCIFHVWRVGRLEHYHSHSATRTTVSPLRFSLVRRHGLDLILIIVISVHFY